MAYTTDMETTISYQLIAEAILPLKVLAQDAVEVATRRKIECLRQRLEENGWDMQKVHPYPSSRLPRSLYVPAVADYQFAQSVITTINSRGPHDPQIVKLDDERIETMVKRSRDDEAISFDAYVYKLSQKIGDGVVSAKLVYNITLWQNSILEVNKEDGTTERWETKIKLNFSKYGLAFHQFPTRKL